MGRAGRCGAAVRAVRRRGGGSRCRKSEAGDPAPPPLSFVNFHKIGAKILLDAAGSWRKRTAGGEIADVGVLQRAAPTSAVFLDLFPLFVRVSITWFLKLT